MLEKMRLRRKALPFDWLMNHDLGLSAVTDMIRDDFQHVINQSDYIKADHHRFDDKMIVYKSYPPIVHLHSNPLEKTADHDVLKRRFERFRNLLHSKHGLHFIYYQNFTEERIENADLRAEQCLENMLRQAKDFLALLSFIPDERISLLLVIEADAHDMGNIPSLVSQISLNDDRISLGYNINRNDKDPVAKKIWFDKWANLILYQTKMPIFMFSICLVRTRMSPEPRVIH